MSVRNQAILWLEKNNGKSQGPVYTSKYYKPEESWPKKSVWWFQIPINSIEENTSGNVNLLCQTLPNENAFYYLKVPSQFLIKNLNKFHIVQGKVSIYLLTEPKRLFIEIRGRGSLNFEEFWVNKI